MDFQSLKDSYLSAWHDKEEKSRQKREEITLIFDEIAKLEDQVACLHKRHAQIAAELISLPLVSWAEYLTIPLVKKLAEKYPHLEWKFDLEGRTTGLRCEWCCFASDPSLKTDFYRGTVVALCFTPGDLSKGEIFIDTGESTKKYPQNTLGSLNGMNNVCVPVHSLEQLIEIVERQLQENSN